MQLYYHVGIVGKEVEGLEVGEGVEEKQRVEEDGGVEGDEERE